MWEQLMQMLQGLAQGGSAMPGMGGPAMTPWSMPPPPPPLPPAAIPPPRPGPPAPVVKNRGVQQPAGGGNFQMPFMGGGGGGQERNNGMNAGMYPRSPLGNMMQPTLTRR